MKPFTNVALVWLTIGAGACRSDFVELPAAVPLRRVQTSISTPFGGSYPGKSVWLSRNGRFVLIYQWREDTNGDGKVSIAIGYHGEMNEDEPRPYLVDTGTGAETAYDELLDAGAARWIALRTGQSVWLVDAETGTRTDLTSEVRLARADENECAGPRSFQLDESRNRIGLIYEDPLRYVVRDLTSNRQRRIYTGDVGEDVLWRARFTAADNVFELYLVPADSIRGKGAGVLPRQATTCATRLGTLFAASYSFAGWDGPPFYALAVRPGRRTVRLAEGAWIVSADLVSVEDTALQRLDGRRVRLPRGCEAFQAAAGSDAVLLGCDSETRLFDAVRGRARRLRRLISLLEGAYGVRDDRGRMWLPVCVERDSTRDSLARPRLGRLRIDNGQLQVGPRVACDDAGVAHDGWAVARGDDAVHALELATGRHFTVPIAGEIYFAFPAVVQRSGPALLLDLDARRYFEAPKIGATNDRGCAIEASGAHSDWTLVELGPWRLRCAADVAR